MAKLTERQQRFCDEYLISLNATQAAIKAGYSKKTARQIGQENLTKPDIKEYIQKRLAEKEDALIAKQDEVLKHLTSVMRRESKEVAVVTTMKKRVFYAPDENGIMRKNEVTEEKAELVEYPAKLSDANRAAELLGKTYSLWDKKSDAESDDMQDDGFIDALQGEVEKVWED